MSWHIGWNCNSLLGGFPEKFLWERNRKFEFRRNSYRRSESERCLTGCQASISFTSTSSTAFSPTFVRLDRQTQTNPESVDSHWQQCQEPGIANPPSLLLPLAYLLRASTSPKLADLAHALGERAGLSAHDFRRHIMAHHDTSPKLNSFQIL